MQYLLMNCSLQLKYWIEMNVYEMLLSARVLLHSFLLSSCWLSLLIIIILTTEKLGGL